MIETNPIAKPKAPNTTHNGMPVHIRPVAIPTNTDRINAPPMIFLSITTLNLLQHRSLAVSHSPPAPDGELPAYHINPSDRLMR